MWMWTNQLMLGSHRFWKKLKYGQRKLAKLRQHENLNLSYQRTTVAFHVKNTHLYCTCFNLEAKENHCPSWKCSSRTPMILEWNHCRFSSTKPCLTAQCSCSAAKLPCTTFCNCQCEATCRHQFTQTYTDINPLTAGAAYIRVFIFFISTSSTLS